MMPCSIEPRIRKYFERYEFLPFERNFLNKDGSGRMDTGRKASKNLIHKAAKATDEFLRNKITDVVSKSNDIKL